MQKLPLEGIRVTDFGQMWAGPHLSQWLAALGAEVIKVETILRLDFMRLVGIPPGIEKTNHNAGTGFACLSCCKKSITLNMNKPRARELAKELIKRSDVVTENFGGPILERWGLSYEDIRKLKPDIIVYAGSGYGRSGPHKARPAYAEIVESMDGSTYANGYPGGPPATVGVSPWMDATQAMHGAFAIIAALHHRSRNGEGQYIDAAMIEGSTNFGAENVMGYFMNRSLGERLGNRHSIMAPHGCYHCKGEDEWVAIAVSNQDEWKAFCEVLGNPEWTGKEEFGDELSRWQNQDEMDSYIDEWTRNYSQYQVMNMLQQVGVTAGASLNVRDLVNDPQLKEREFFIETEHPVMGRIVLASVPVRLSDTPRVDYTCPPLLGEYNDYVFGELLGLSPEEIARLKEEEVIH
jgi:benzylsuccinate CoA-transferase BbsF subunit